MGDIELCRSEFHRIYRCRNRTERYRCVLCITMEESLPAFAAGNGAEQMIDSISFFYIWLSFTVLVLCAVIPFVIWAIRSGQFSKFDYASRLPLKSMIPEINSENKKSSAVFDKPAGTEGKK